MNQIRPEVAEILALYAGFAREEMPVNPCWYWLDYNAEHGASKEVVSWLLNDAERYEELVKR